MSVDSDAKGSTGRGARPPPTSSRRGWTVLARNFRTRRGEIDIIARHGDVVAFVEVKSWRVVPREDLARSIGPRKRSRIARAARLFLSGNPDLERARLRFDVVFLGGERGRASAHRGSLQRRGDRLMVRIAKKTDPKKLAELKVKIHDEEYLLQAIQKIAQDLTRNLEHGE